MKREMVPIAFGVLALASQAFAQSNFSQTKTFEFIGSNAGAVPKLEGARYGHVYYEYNKGQEGLAQYIPNDRQANGYDSFSPDRANRGPVGTGRLELKNTRNGVGIVLLPVQELVNLGKIVKKPMDPDKLTVETPLVVQTPNGSANASITIEVTERIENKAAGSVVVQGGHTMVPKMPAGEAGFAFAYGHVKYTNPGVTGTIKVGERKINASFPINGGQEKGGKTGAWDPVILRLTNESNETLLEHELYSSFAEVAEGTLEWNGDRLRIDAQQASFHIEASPLDSRDPGGSLSIMISDGVVTLVGKSGVAFNSCSLPEVGSAGRMNCSLQNERTFRYDLSQYATAPGQQLSVTGEFLGLGYAENATLSHRVIEPPLE